MGTIDQPLALEIGGVNRQEQKAAGSYWAISSQGERKHRGDPTELQNVCVLCFIVLPVWSMLWLHVASLALVLMPGFGSWAQLSFSDIAMREAMIHHPSIRQHLGDSDSQIVLTYFLLPLLPTSVPATWRRVSQGAVLSVNLVEQDVF